MCTLYRVRECGSGERIVRLDSVEYESTGVSHFYIPKRTHFALGTEIWVLLILSSFSVELGWGRQRGGHRFRALSKHVSSKVESRKHCWGDWF